MTVVSVPASLDLDLDLLKGPKGDPGTPGTTPDLSTYTTKADVQALIAAALASSPVVVPPVITPPPSTGRRFALPNTVRTIQLPPSIDATGKTDVTTALKNFLSTIPDGTLILGGGPAAIYRHTGSILPAMAGHNHWVLDWLGATTDNRATTAIAGGPPGSDEYAMSTFWCHWGDKPFPTHLTIRNLVAKGASPTPGQLNGHEYHAVAHLFGADWVELDNVKAGGFFGDLATFNEDAQYGWVHGSQTTDTGRNNVSVVCGSHIYVEDNQFGQSGYCVYDLEPEPGSIAPIDDVVIRRNSDKGYWSSSKAKSWLAVDGVDSGKKVTNLAVDANSSLGPLTMSVGGAAGKARPGHVSITGNAGAAGGNVTIRHTDFLTAKSNTAAGKLIVPSTPDCPSPVLS